MKESLFDESKIGFDVTLDVFSGPFEVLLSLIAKKKLDITDVALAEVTDEFIAFANRRAEFDLSSASEFLLVASTLLALKASRLLPQTEDDDEDLELLEARDLLFAKLLQYRAYKELSLQLARTLAEQSLAAPRDVPLEPQLAGLMPEVDLVSPDALAALAHAAFTRDHEAPTIGLAHLHHPSVSVESQVLELTGRLKGRPGLSFRELCADAGNVATVVARFLAVLDLLKDSKVDIEQTDVLGELVVSWRT